MNSEPMDTERSDSKGRTPAWRFTPLAVWGLAFGCCVGWGAFVMPGTTFLPLAGPLGTCLGLLLGALCLLVVGVNYHYMARRGNDGGGSTSYVREALGCDHAFLCAWFLWLAYASIIWANATAFALLVRRYGGNALKFGLHYTVAGYEVWLGEVLLSAGVILFFGCLCLWRNRWAVRLNTGLAVLLAGGIAWCFADVFADSGGLAGLAPAFAPGASHAFQIFGALALAPWAFVGFEATSHVAGEINFSRRFLLWPVACGLLCAVAAYAALVAVAAAPLVKEGWQAWASARAAGGGAGMSGMPVFSVVAEHMGSSGKAVLAACVLAAVGTAVTGFTIALSRLSCSLAEHGVLPPWFGMRTERGIPRSAILFLMAVSIAVACTGRTTIGWVVDVSSVCASIVYAYVSAAAFVQARREGDRLHAAAGLAGTVIGCAFFFFVSMPSVWSIGSLATESYCLFAVWGILGICFFLSVLGRDREGRFGHSALVWLFMLFFIFKASHQWIRQEAHETALGIMAKTAEHFNVLPGTPDEVFIGKQVEAFGQHLVRDSALQLTLVALIIAVVFGMYWLMRTRWNQVETRRIQAEEASRLKSGFLSSMSHDFRTPMNAVIGFTNLALSKYDVPTIHAYLHKINLSSSHMLSLINNVLEMSQIEGGRVELHLSPVNIPELMRALHVMLLGQVAAKRHTVDVNAIGVRHENILCDRLRLSQVLINICGNAIKFTPPGGHVEVNIRELEPEGSADEASFEVRVKDNGIGMSKEFLARNFQAFEREGGDAEQRLGGTGLGMAVTMNLIALMQGTVRVESELGKGTEFILGFRFRTVGGNESQASEPFDASGLKVLVADDDSNACRALIGHLEAMGASAEWTMSGHEAIQRSDAALSADDPFDVCILEWRMRDMSGVDAARAMADMAASAGRGIGLVLVTAYDIERVRKASEGTGVAAICAKPVFASELRRALAKALGCQNRQAEEASGKDVDFTGRRVLLVDDIEVNREIAAAVLAMNGFEVDEAEDGVQALAKVEQAAAGHYDVVLMDLQMPNMDGFEATRAIRALADKAKAKVPVIALSANSSDADIQAGRDAGMNGHLVKPIDLDKLFALLRQVLGA